MNRLQAKYAREREAIRKAASEITDLWWTNPTENDHVKTAIVANIIQRHLWGLTDGDVARAAIAKAKGE